MSRPYRHLWAYSSETEGCANDTCQWLFFDQSKNRLKKWCEMQTCGNAVNARAYRQRHRHQAPAPSSQQSS
jgi:predicted RNA-binding Zn ribbon-like protein